jgi:hypothetical protein
MVAIISYIKRTVRPDAASVRMIQKIASPGIQQVSFTIKTLPDVLRN